MLPARPSGTWTPGSASGTEVSHPAGLSAAAGHVLWPGERPYRRAGAGVRGRALLAMLVDKLLPEAFGVEGALTAPLVVSGFAISLALSAF